MIALGVSFDRLLTSCLLWKQMGDLSTVVDWRRLQGFTNDCISLHFPFDSCAANASEDGTLFVPYL